MTTTENVADDSWYVELVRASTRTYSGPYPNRQAAARRAAMAYRFAPGAPTSVAVLQHPGLKPPEPGAQWYLSAKRADGIRCFSGPFTTCSAAADHAFAMRECVPGIAPDGDFSLLWTRVAAPACT